MADGTTPAATSVSSADVANANALNQAVSAIRQQLAADNTAQLAILNSIASAIPASMVGGTTGTADSHILLSKGTTGFALKASPSIVQGGSNELQVSINTAGSSTEYFRLRPTDFATGKPYFTIKSGGAINDWQILLWDGTNTNGTLDFFVQTLNYNGNQVATTNQLTTVINPAVDIRTGSATITIPAGATKLYIQLVGGGGGGGGASAGTTGCGASASVGGTGGPAGVLAKSLTGLTPGNTLSLTIGGAGSAGAANGGNGGNGGNSSLASGSQSITTLTASGGTGGQGGGTGTTGTNGTAGTGTNGDLNWTGVISGALIITGLGFGYVGPFPSGSNVTGPNGLGYGGPGNGAFNSTTNPGHAGGAGTAGVAILHWFN